MTQSDEAPPPSGSTPAGSRPDYAILAAVLFIALASAAFAAFPGIDLRVSALFYAPGHGFPLATNAGLIALRRSGEIAVVAGAIWLVVTLAARIARPEQPGLVPPGIAIFLLWALVLGPGLVVNLVLKDSWGRPRPFMIEAFGGSAPYVGVWRITDYCVSNCSFVAGEASSAVWLIGLALVVPKAWRKAAAIALAAYALILSINRIAFGGHFVSDVLLAWGLTALVMLVLYRLMVASPPAWLAHERLEANLAAIGRRLRSRPPR